MKLIIENWRKYIKIEKESKMFLFEGKNTQEVSFDKRLESLNESNKSPKAFLIEWEKSADYVLEANELNEGVLDLVNQAAKTLASLGKKSWKTVTSVVSKILSFIEKFKQGHPKMYTAIKWACTAVLSIAALYLIANVTDMNSVTAAMESLASLQWPDVTISELVKDLTNQQTVEALRLFRDGLFEKITEYAGQLIQSDNSMIRELGQSLMDQMPEKHQVEEVHDIWAEMMQAADPQAGF